MARFILPDLLITTSRKTSNRVRSFSRDLWSVLPGSDRFNRGGMGLAELSSRILQSGAKAALIISQWHGNPGELSFVDAEGKEFASLRVESALLRRETRQSARPKINSLLSISVKTESSESTDLLASILGNIFDLPVEYYSEPVLTRKKGQCILSLENTPSGKIIWTHYHAMDGTEIGPRIRIKELRSSNLDQASKRQNRFSHSL